MKINRILLVSFLLILCLGMFSSPVIAQEDPGDELVNMPSQAINPGSFSNLQIIYVKFKWNETGNGIYMHVEFNATVDRVCIINSTIRDYLLSPGSHQLNDSITLDGFAASVDTFDYQFVIPYNMDFYFVAINIDPYAIWMDGWYAKDVTTPQGNYWGIEAGKHLNKGDVITVGCYFDADRFNITQLIFNIGLYPLDSEDVNTNGPINWTVEANTNYFGGYGNTYLNFTVVDGAGNAGSTIVDIYLINPVTTTITPSPIFIMEALVGLIVICSVGGGISYYRNYRKTEQDRIAEEKKKEKERPYHKGHRDSKKNKKRKKHWDE